MGPNQVLIGVTSHWGVPYFVWIHPVEDKAGVSLRWDVASTWTWSGPVPCLTYILCLEPAWIGTKYVRQTSDGTRPRPCGCDITLEGDHSSVWARVNSNKVVKHLMGPNQVLIDGHTEVCATLFEFTCAGIKLWFHSSGMSHRCGRGRVPSDVGRTYFVPKFCFCLLFCLFCVLSFFNCFWKCYKNKHCAYSLAWLLLCRC